MLSSISNNRYVSGLTGLVSEQYSYANSHWQSACSSTDWVGRVVHALTCFVELIPILGTIVYLAEKYLFSPTTSTSSSSPPQSSPRSSQPSSSSTRRPPLPHDFIKEDNSDLSPEEMELKQMIMSFDIERVQDAVKRLTLEAKKEMFKKVAPQALRLALQNQSIPFARWLLSNGFDPNTTKTERDFGQMIEKPVLEYFCGNYYSQIVDYLSNIPGITRETYTHLLRELIYFHKDMSTFENDKVTIAQTIQFFLDRGADSSVYPTHPPTDYQDSALSLAIVHAPFPEDLLKELIARVPDAATPIKGTGETVPDLLRVHRPSLLAEPGLDS